MRIMELCLSPDFGGLEMAMCDFARWLRACNDADLFLCTTADTRIDQSLNALGAPTLSFRGRRQKVPFRRAWQLARWIDQHQIDVVHIHWKFDLPLAALAKRMCRHPVRLVHTRHMNIPGKKHDPYHAWLYRSLDQLIVVTEYLRDQATRHLPMDANRIRVVYNGVAPSTPVSPEQTRRRAAELGIKEGFHVGLFGRISEYKGQHLLIEAVRQIHAHGKLIHAWIIGEPFEQEYLARLRRQAQRVGLADHVHFVGFQENPLELMPAFDVIALTTRNETFGLVLVEAMRSKVAVVGSDEGGVPEIIDHGTTGLLFETWDATSLAGQIERLHDDPELRAELAAAGHSKAIERFDRDRQFMRVLGCLRQCMQAARSGDTSGHSQESLQPQPILESQRRAS